MPTDCMASDVEVVESFLNENYELRYNTLSHKLEIREQTDDSCEQKLFRIFTQETMNSIVIAARKKLVILRGLRP